MNRCRESGCEIAGCRRAANVFRDLDRAAQILFSAIQVLLIESQLTDGIKRCRLIQAIRQHLKRFQRLCIIRICIRKLFLKRVNLAHASAHACGFHDPGRFREESERCFEMSEGSCWIIHGDESLSENLVTHSDNVWFVYFFGFCDSCFRGGYCVVILSGSEISLSHVEGDVGYCLRVFCLTKVFGRFL